VLYAGATTWGFSRDKSGHRQWLHNALALPASCNAIACNATRHCLAIADPLPLPLPLPSRDACKNAYFCPQKAVQPEQSSTIGFSNMTFPFLWLSRPREAQTSRSQQDAVVDSLPLPAMAMALLARIALSLPAHCHCHCRFQAMPLPTYGLLPVAVVGCREPPWHSNMLIY
jgi:hypothetical protein